MTETAAAADLAADTETSSDDAKARPGRALVYRVLAVRQRALGPQGNGRGILAAFASAIHPMTEATAYPYTEALLGDLGPEQRIGARRAAAMVAVHRETRATGEGTYTPIGATLRRLHHADQQSWPGAIDSSGSVKRTAMSMQVDSLPLLDVENAAQIIGGLVGRCAGHDIPVDFASLASTLAFWGDGMSARSRKHRARVVQDFYGLSDNLTT